MTRSDQLKRIQAKDYTNPHLGSFIDSIWNHAEKHWDDEAERKVSQHNDTANGG